MQSYFQEFIERWEKLISFFNPYLKKKEKYGIIFYLILANVGLIFVLILFLNLDIFPFNRVEDFGFFAFIFLLMALYRPGWSFLFFIGVIALENINLAPEILGLAIRPYQFIGALTILAVLIRLVSKRLDFSFLKINWQDKAVIIFTAASFINVLFGTETWSIASLREAIIIFSFATLYFLARLFIQNLDDVKKIIPFFLSSSFVVILYGIWQNVRFIKGLESFETMPGRPNATFMEADWLGMFLALVLAVIYSLIFYFYKTGNNAESNISNFRFPTSDKITIFAIQIKKSLLPIFYFLFLMLTYILLILTVSRSAWLGMGIVSVLFLAFCLYYFIKNNDKKNIWIPAFTGIMFAVAFGIVHIFSLTNFELGNRLQSAGSGLQEITVACVIAEDKHISSLPKIIHNVSELEQFGCRLINLEEIEEEKTKGNIITRIYRDDPNVIIRSEIYRKSWEEIKKHPVLGIGWGNISQVLGTDERGAGLNSSNIFLEVWLGTGLIGLVSFVFILLNILFKSIFNLKKGITSFNLFLSLSFFAILIPNLFNAGIMLGFLWIWLAVANIKS